MNIKIPFSKGHLIYPIGSILPKNKNYILDSNITDVVKRGIWSEKFIMSFVGFNLDEYLVSELEMMAYGYLNRIEIEYSSFRLKLNGYLQKLEHESRKEFFISLGFENTAAGFSYTESIENCEKLVNKMTLILKTNPNLQDMGLFNS